MFTKCPNPRCRAVYCITAQHLQLAMGMIRCPRCRNVFNALSSIDDSTREHARDVEQITRQLPYAQRGDRIVLSHAAASKQPWYQRLQEARREISLRQTPAPGAAAPQSGAGVSAASESISYDDESSAVTSAPQDFSPELRDPQNISPPISSGLLATAGDLGLALRNVIRQGRRSALGLCAIIFGVIAMLLAGGFIEWSLWALRESAIFSRFGHIQVVRPGYLEYGQADPYSYHLPEQSAVLDALEQHPAVRAVAPRLGFSGLIAFGDISVSFVAEGVVPERERVAAAKLVLRDGRDLSADEPNGIIMGKGLAANLGAKPGDVVVLLATTESGTLSAVEVEILGVFQTSTKAYDDVALRIPLQTAQSLLEVQGAHKWVVLLDDTDSTDRVAAELEQRFSPQEAGVQFVPWIELADFYKKTASLLSAQMSVVRIAIMIIIIFSISNTLAMSIVERTAEIGTLLALGLRRIRILKLFLNEGIVLGVAGGMVGVALGFAMGAGISAVGIPMPPPPGADFSFKGEIMVTWSLAVGALVLAILSTIVASVYPSWKASRLEIVDALRHAR